jgi:uncharacterized protein YndB with AHSA1/START domain
MTSVERSVLIDAPIDAVFEFVADPRRDVHWCPRVASCEQRAGVGPGCGARYEAQHNPTFQKPHARSIEVLAFEPPTRIVTLQSDRVGDFRITYLLEEAGGRTRFTQSDEIAWKLSRFSRPFGVLIVRRHIRDQLSRLARLLEARAVAGGSS